MSVQSAESHQIDFVSPEDLLKMRDMVSQMAKFIALYEQSAQKIERHEVTSGQRLQESEKYFRSRLEEVNRSINDMRSMMTEIGVARFAVLAEETLQKGETHIEVLKQNSDDAQAQLAAGILQLETAVKKAAEDFAKASKSIRLEELKELTDEAARRINDTTERAVRRLTGTLSWLHWERISVIFIIALIVALATGAFGGGFSSESKKTLQNERFVGQAILRAWPELSEEDKEKIKNAMKVM
jgi:hypothetical protein